MLILSFINIYLVICLIYHRQFKNLHSKRIIFYFLLFFLICWLAPPDIFISGALSVMLILPNEILILLTKTETLWKRLDSNQRSIKQ